MIEQRNEIINGKEFTVFESILRHYDGTIVKRPFRYIFEKDTDKRYDGIVYDLKGYEKEYEETEIDIEGEQDDFNIREQH